MRKLLLIFAHPDDESFASGGTAAKYATAGWDVSAVCATSGQRGETGPYGRLSANALGEIRQKELEQAGQLLGIRSVKFLSYMDGSLSSLLAGELEDKLYRIMTENIPDVTITFDTTGISNHPDHIKLCYATTFAFQKYAAWTEDALTKQGAFDEALLPKLYYACMPESIAAYLVKSKNIPKESFGKPWSGTPDRLVTTVIDIRRFAAVKKKALLCHVSQQADVRRFLSLATNPLARQEYFILRMHGTKEVFMGRNDRVSNRL